jgi:hypothetical protein
MALTQHYGLKATVLLQGKLQESTQKHYSEDRKLDSCILNFTFQTILLSSKFHCTEEILTIVSLLSVDSVLYNPPARRDEVQSVRKKFISSEGDHITLLNIYRTFKNIGGNKVSLPHALRHVLLRMLLFWPHHLKESLCLAVSLCLCISLTYTQYTHRCVNTGISLKMLFQVFVLLVFSRLCGQVS